MPLLPSGLMVGFFADAIPTEPVFYGYCPPGHFIYYVPNKEICGDPPYPPNTVLLERPVAAPLPRNYMELLRYLRVLFVDVEGEPWWAGDWLSEFPGRVQLDEEDLRVWNDWLFNAENLRFFDVLMERCLDQADHIAESGRGDEGNQGVMRLCTTSPEHKTPMSYSSKLEFFKLYCIRNGLPLPDIMNEQELHTFGVQIVVDKLETMGFSIRDVDTTLIHNPQITADKGEIFAAVCVRTDCYPSKGKLAQDEYPRFMREANDMDAIPYFASVCVTNIDGKNEAEMGMPIRGGELEVTIDGPWMLFTSDHVFVLGDDGVMHRADEL